MLRFEAKISRRGKIKEIEFFSPDFEAAKRVARAGGSIIITLKEVVKS